MARIVYGGGGGGGGKSFIVRRIYKKFTDKDTASKHVTIKDYEQKKKTTSQEAYLPIVYGNSNLDAQMIWRSTPIKTTIVGTGKSGAGMVYYGLFAVAGDNYEMAVFPTAATGYAYILTYNNSYIGGAFGYPFTARTDWFIHWTCGWVVAYGATSVVGTGTVFPALYKGDGGSGEYESHLKVEDWEDWIAKKTYTIPRSIWDTLSLGEQFSLTNSWYNDFISGVEFTQTYRVTNGATLYNLVKLQNMQNIGNGTEMRPEMGIYASRMPGIVTYGVMFAQLDDEEVKGPDLKISYNKPNNWYKNIIIDLLHRAGHDITQYTKNNIGITGDTGTEYYIHIIFNDQMTIKEAIESILERTGTQLYYLDRYYMKQKYPTDYTVAAVLQQNEIGFELSTQEMDEIPRFYKGFFTEVDNYFIEDYKHEVTISNDSLITSNGPKDKNIDLDHLYDEASAVKMLSIIMKNETWPKLYGTIEVSKRYYTLKAGDVVTLNLPDYLPGTIDLEISRKEVGEETITFDVVQISPISEQNAGPSEEYEGYVEADIPPIASAALLELPENTRYEHDSVFLLNCNMNSDLLNYMTSNSGFVYQILLYKGTSPTGPFSYWKNMGDETIYRRIISATGTLGNALYEDDPEHTLESDLSYYIQANSLNYGTTMYIDDIAIIKIGSEYMIAQAVSKVGSVWRFFGITRRQFGTEPANHSIGEAINIFICHPGTSAAFGFDASWNELNYRNILETDEDCYIKPIILKTGLNQISNISATPAIHLVPTALAEKPLKVGRIKAVRSGASVDIDWHPRSYLSVYDGAGIKRAQDQVPPVEPWPHEGDFKYRIDGGGWVQVSAYTLTVPSAVAFTIEVCQNRDGVEGEIRSCAVGASDGTYIDGIKID